MVDDEDITVPWWAWLGLWGITLAGMTAGHELLPWGGMFVGAMPGAGAMALLVAGRRDLVPRHPDAAARGGSLLRRPRRTVGQWLDAAELAVQVVGVLGLLALAQAWLV